MLYDNGVWSNKIEKYFYILDTTENSFRMRNRLLYNPKGTNYSQSTDFEPFKSKEDENFNEKKKIDLMKSSELVGSIIKKSLEENSNYFSIENVIEEDNNEYDLEGEDKIDEEWIGVNENETDIMKSDIEKTISIINCELILPLNVIKGTFEITSTNIYFFPSVMVESNNITLKLSINDINEIFKRRYLLQYTAMEIFFQNKRNYFFNFDKNDINKAYDVIINQKPSNLKFDGFHQTPQQLIKKSKFTQMWQKREITNFEYLMILNTFANRTYNDLTQYPVFPWVIKDYSSDTIDLDDKNVYRDLTKPIGALTEKKCEVAKEKFKYFEDPHIPKFHYGSHYSSVGSTLYYLSRIEPFTQQNIILQGYIFFNTKVEALIYLIDNFFQLNQLGAI
jgi:hypothetical protein